MADFETYNHTMMSGASPAEAPFLKKDLIYITDEGSGSGDYSRNEVVFDTQNVSNSGKWCDFKEAVISIPVVVAVSRRKTTGGEHAAGLTTDMFKSLRMKSGASMIDSVTVEYNNSTVVQQRKNISAYSSFKQHTEYSLNDVEINGSSNGYYKPTPLWKYDDQLGLISNDCESSNPDELYPVQDDDPERIGVLSADNVNKSGTDCQKHENGDHVYYFDQRVRLKDLIMFDQLPLLKGSKVKITLTLNQCETKFDLGVDGQIRASGANNVPTYASVTLKGSSCPFLRAPMISHNPVMADANKMTETIVCSVAKATVNGNEYSHVKNHCRLYIPTYVLEAKHEERLIMGEKLVTYSDVFVTKLSNLTGGFQSTITNSISRASRLIIVPMLTADANGSKKISPSSSFFTNEPASCSPHYIKDLNVSLSGTNIYQQSLKYKYEHFVNEIQGKFGEMAGMHTGVSSGLISLKDYENTLGYIVVNLGRRHKYDDHTSVSLEIQGTVDSPKSLDLLCFVEFDRDMTIEMASGELK
jgi:hypothetical protein